MTPFVRCQLRNRTDLSLFCPMFCIWHLENKHITKILPKLLVLVIPVYLVLHLSLLLYSYGENVEKEIYTTRPLRAWI